MTDEQLIERIRAGLNDQVVGLHPPADLLDRLQSASTERSRRPLWLPAGFGATVAMVAGVGVVVLVVVAIATVGHRSSSSSAGSSVPAGVPPDARALVARMAVLRRPPRPADRLPASVIAEEASSGGALRIIPGLTRLAATVDVGPGPLSAVEIYVVVGRPPGYPEDIVTALEVAGRHGHRYLLYPANVVDTETAAATGGLAPRAVSYNAGLARKEWLDVGVVPDGVTRVRWVFPGPGGATVFPTVENNVAVPRAGKLGGLLDATWYGSDGHVVASYSEVAAQQAEAARALAASARQPIAPALIEHFALFHRQLPSAAKIKQLPYHVAVKIAQQGYGINVKQARFVPYPGTPGLWVIPGARGVSMAQLTGQGASGDDVTVSNALSGRMITTSCCTPAGKTVWGLVPDGNQSVTAVLADGTSRPVRVIGNVYLVTGRVTAIIAKDAAGRRITIQAPG